jgi:2-methylcitrate dehydratase PrpD
VTSLTTDNEVRGATAELAAFAVSVTEQSLTDGLVRELKRHVLDQLGVQLACTGLPWIKIVGDYALAHGKPGAATVLGRTETLDAEYAALVNATSGHGFELDDSSAGASAHPSCGSVPPVLAVGEEQECSGRDALVALAIGYETVTRVGLAVSPSLLMDRGFHETCVESVFSAALCAGRLMKFDTGQFVTALGIAGSHASGTAEFSQSGGDVKRLHAGLGVMGGIRSARLAAMGFTAPRAIIEGRRGFLQAFCERYQVEAITDGLGSRWEFEPRGTLRVHCCAGSIGPRIDAAVRALAESGRSVDDIAEIVLGLDRKAMTHIGSVGPYPTNITAAQFSAHFAVALALTKGAADFDAFVAAAASDFSDPAVTSLSGRIRTEFDPDCEAELPARLMGKVAIRFRDGSVVREKAFYKGDPVDPLTDAEVQEKFLGLATRAVPEAQARQIIDAVANLEVLGSIRELTRLLVDRSVPRR